MTLNFVAKLKSYPSQTNIQWTGDLEFVRRYFPEGSGVDTAVLDSGHLHIYCIEGPYRYSVLVDRHDWVVWKGGRPKKIYSWADRFIRMIALEITEVQ